MRATLLLAALGGLSCGAEAPYPEAPDTDGAPPMAQPVARPAVTVGDPTAGPVTAGPRVINARPGEMIRGRDVGTVVPRPGVGVIVTALMRDGSSRMLRVETSEDGVVRMWEELPEPFSASSLPPADTCPAAPAVDQPGSTACASPHSTPR